MHPGWFQPRQREIGFSTHSQERPDLRGPYFKELTQAFEIVRLRVITCSSSYFAVVLLMARETVLSSRLTCLSAFGAKRWQGFLPMPLSVGGGLRNRPALDWQPISAS
jgi:hypothetical protein